jgi:hypothetical protein
MRRCAYAPDLSHATRGVDINLDPRLLVIPVRQYHGRHYTPLTYPLSQPAMFSVPLAEM